MALEFDEAMQFMALVRTEMKDMKRRLVEQANHWTQEVVPKIDALTPADKQVLQDMVTPTSDGVAKLEAALALQVKIQTAVDAVYDAFGIIPQ